MHDRHAPGSQFREPGAVLLDTAKQGPGEGALLFAHPLRELEARAGADVIPVLEAANQAVEAGYHVAGFVSYEAGAACVGLPTARIGPEPLVWLGVYTRPMALELPEAESAVPIGERRLAIDRDAYEVAIRRIKEHIREGDVYQVNLTTSLTFDYDGDPFAVYRQLRTRQRVAYGAFIPRPNGAILSFSPELFFSIDGREIIARPMKGTARRGGTAADDARLGEWLLADAKNRAENLMIVDLLRNDLSRICEVGSVQVPALFSLETYETLYQMTSTVTGRLLPNVTLPALFRALFPCGSITGAPKISAMQRIDAIEPEPRGVYCGAIGYVSPGGKAAFNVAIRTLELRDGHGRMGIGSGIVWDSDPRAEYEECLLKGAFLGG
ncbi:MAG: aminodeoxychorismate synthase component I [Rhodothermales bacterium]|nr:aminodeoxychorismate synthase component I [Rhodothermales bacterium]